MIISTVREALIFLDTDHEGNRIHEATAVDALAALDGLEEQMERVERDRVAVATRANVLAEERDRLEEQHAALVSLAESVRDSWVLWQNDVDIAHLDHACSELDNWLARQAAREAVGG